jgi:hypothetical protein
LRVKNLYGFEVSKGCAIYLCQDNRLVLLDILKYEILSPGKGRVKACLPAGEILTGKDFFSACAAGAKIKELSKR